MVIFPDLQQGQGQDQGLGPLIVEEALEAEEVKTVIRVKTAGPVEAVGAVRGRQE